MENIQDLFDQILSNVVYIGYDIPQALTPLKGYKGVVDPHITLAFRPTYNEALMILEQNPQFEEFKVTGYGRNNTNEAVSVEKPKNCKNDIAHITISHKGRPVDSNLLTFNSGDLEKKLKERNIPDKFIGILTFVTTDGKRWNL